MKKLTLSMAMMVGVTMFAQTDIKQQITDGAMEKSGELYSDGKDAVIEKFASGDVTWGVRANGLINTSSLGKLSDVKQLKESGFNVGVSATLNFAPNFFASPELYYTKLGTSKIDLPILVGYKISNVFAVVAGPALSYSFSADSKAHGEQIKNELMTTGTVDLSALSNKFNFGYQAGLQAHISNFVISAKYEGSLSSQIVEYANQVSGQKFSEKVQTNVISLGVGYNFSFN